MNVLVVNSGSSSVKFQLLQMPREEVLMKCTAVKNENNETYLNFNTPARNVSFAMKEFSFSAICQVLIDELVRPESECLSSVSEVDAIGHRLIHGGEKGEGCEEITEELITWMESLVSLAPLHYPANLEGIHTLRKLMPHAIHAGVFDTAFHSSLPPRAYLYGIPTYWHQQHRIRRYGFHGTSHRYASRTACQLAGLTDEKSRIVSCHLGNGASVAAVKDGKSIDTSMGLTPVEGLIMGSRCGDIDAGILTHLMETQRFSVSDLQHLINKESGLLGLSGVSSDYRVVEEAAMKGNNRAQTALDVYHYRVKKYIGAYAAALEGIDVLVFTGGIGENSSIARAEICKGMQFLNIELDSKKNEKPGAKEAIISITGSPVTVVVVTAHEELEIARQVASLAASVKTMG